MTTSASAAQAPQHPPRHKRSLKNYLLDSRFQLKYTGLIVAVAVLISGVLGSFLYKTSRTVVDEGGKVVDESKKALEESKKVSEVTRMNMKDLGYDNPELAASFDTEAAAQDKALEEQKNAIVRQQNSLVTQQSVMLFTLVGGLTVMVALIGLLGIWFTHKVAGPVYKMKRLLRQVGEGKLHVESRLRKGDELQDFFESFASMVDSLRARQAGEVEQLDGALAHAKSTGASEEALAKIVRVRDDMQRQLQT
jgi:methyl-accepting chemotaxis protein